MTLAVIPARGGSRGLKRKNLLPNPDGAPLFLASARAAANAGCHVIVSTDDTEIGSIATVNGFDIHWRNGLYADVPVDKVVEAAAIHVNHQGPVLLVQPTVQPITPDILTAFIKDAETSGVATQGAHTDRHLTWHRGQLLSARVERQQLADWPLRETGLRWWPGLPLGHPPRVTTVPLLSDIDTAGDYRALPSGRLVRLVFTANKLHGSGHLRRALLLAERLQHHHLEFQPTLDTEAWAVETVKDRGWTIADPFSTDTIPDVWINDTLDTDPLIVADPAYMAAASRLHLEDSGPGRRYADATINALYHTPGTYTGAKWADIRPEFLHTPYVVRQSAKQAMLMFGGTDPSGLGERVAHLLKGVCDVDLIRPEDGRMVAAAMQNADVLVTSGGRTVFEAAAVGIPTVVLSQNVRETTHTHLGVGNLHLGLGRLVTDSTIMHTVLTLLNDYSLRVELSASGKLSIDGLGVSRIAGMVDWLAAHGAPPTMER